MAPSSNALPPKGSRPPDGNASQNQALVGMTIAMLSLSCIFVVLRFMTRIWVVRALKWDDWTILFALLGTIIGAGLDFPEFELGYGRHRYYINDEAYAKFAYYSYGEWIQTFATLMWTKVSICLFLLHIPVTKALRRPLQAAIVILIVSNVVLTLMYILQCRPVAAVWNPKVEGKCFSTNIVVNIIFAQGVISAVSDFTLATFPILILYRLKMSPWTKAGLCLLMGLGLITGACCIVRIVINGENGSKDVTWDSIPNWMWRCLEVNFGIAAACLPAVHPGYKRVKNSISSFRSHRSSDVEETKIPVLAPQVLDPSIEPASPPRIYHPENSSQLEFLTHESGIRKTTELNIQNAPRKKRWINSSITRPNLQSTVVRSLLRLERDDPNLAKGDLV